MFFSRVLAILLISLYICSTLSSDSFYAAYNNKHGMIRRLLKGNDKTKSDTETINEEEDDEEEEESYSTDSDNENGCETAYANFDSYDDVTCFLDDGFSRWGWTLGPIIYDTSESISLTSDIYAAAGQCDLSKGEFVGTFTLNINENGTFTAELNALSGYTFTEFHLYIGTNKYPTKNGKDTVAPGQYTFKTSDSDYISDTIQNFDTETGYYIIVHTVSCGSGTGSDSDTDTDPNDDVTTQKPEETSIENEESTTLQPVTSQSTASNTESPQSTVTSCNNNENNYIILSNGWSLDNINIDGTYILDTDSSLGNAGFAWIREDGLYAITFTENSPDFNYWLNIINVNDAFNTYFTYSYSSNYWSNNNNPLVEDANNWNSDLTESDFTTGDANMYDCEGNDLGDTLCTDNDVSLFPEIYECIEGVPGSLNTSKAKRIEYALSVWVSLIVVGMMTLLNM